MLQITEISDSPRQKLNVVTENNEDFDLVLEYSDQQQGWFYSITFNDFVLNGARLVTGPNILRNYQNLIPFGIGILSEDGSEPIFVDDFSSGRIQFFLLNEEDVQEIETEFYDS